MHYMDDWYVLAARVNVYTLIYYCGCNDACCGHAGAVLYTRSPHFEDLSAQDCVLGVGIGCIHSCLWNRRYMLHLENAVRVGVWIRVFVLDFSRDHETKYPSNHLQSSLRMLKKSKVPSVAQKFLASTLKVFVLPWHRVVQVSQISWRSPAACTAQMYKMTGALNLKPSTISQHYSLSVDSSWLSCDVRCHGWKKMVQVCPGERHGCRHALLGDPRHDVYFAVTSESSNADTRLASY